MIGMCCNGYQLKHGSEISMVKKFLKEVLEKHSSSAEEMASSIKSLLEECPLFQADTDKMLIIHHHDTNVL